MKSDGRGFTLVEILIVIAIISMLAALAIPNLLRARLNSNEVVAQGILKVVATACENFHAAQTSPRYPLDLAELTTATPQFLDSTLDTNTTGVPRNGYNYTYTRFNDIQYVCSATPAVVNGTGNRTFGMNESGVLRATSNGGAVINTELLYNGMDACQ